MPSHAIIDHPCHHATFPHRVVKYPGGPHAPPQRARLPFPARSGPPPVRQLATVQAALAKTQAKLTAVSTLYTESMQREAVLKVQLDQLNQ